MPPKRQSDSDSRDGRDDPRDRVRVATNFVRPLARALKALGFDPAVVLAGLGGRDLPARVAFGVAARTWENACEITGDPRIGLVASTHLVAGDFGLLEFLGRSSPTLGAAIERLDRYHRLLNDGAQVRLEREQRRGRIRYVGPASLAMPRAYVEFVLASWVRVAREVFDAGAGMLGAALPFPRPADCSLHRALLGDELVFDAQHADLYLSLDLLDQPTVGADAELVGALDRHAATVLARSGAGQPFGARVVEEVKARLSDGSPRLGIVASALGVPERVLRRRLEEEDSSFAKIVDTLRHELALAWVQDPSLSLGEIAFLLGFSEASAFHRAFRRWTGRTPRGGRRAVSL